MPYNPGASYQGGQFIAQGRRDLISSILQLVGGLTEQSRQAKEYRALLSDVDPQNAERYKKMSLGELQGAYQAKDFEMKQTAATNLATEARQRIAAANDLQTGRNQLGPFFAAWQNNMNPVSALTSGGQPAAGPPGPGMGALQAALAAGGTYPLGAEVSGASRYFPALIRSADENGNPVDITPTTWSAGGLSGVMFPKTGKEVLGVESQKALAEARRGPQGTNRSGPPAGFERIPALDSEGNKIPGLYDLRDPKTKKITGSWMNPHHSTRGSSILDMVGGGAGGGNPTAALKFAKPEDVAAAYKAGKFGTGPTAWDAAAAALEQFQPATTTADAEGDEEEGD